jgi:MFS family permease
MPPSTSPLPGAVEENDFGERTPVLLHGVGIPGSRSSSATIDSIGITTGDTTPQTVPRLIAPESELDHIGFGRFQVVMLMILGLANASDAVELLALSFILPKLDTTDNAKAALSAAIFVGMLFGGLFFGIAADSLGRRTTLAVSLAINAFFGLISSIAPTTSFLFVARALGGFGVGGSIPGVFTLAAELLPTASRSFWLSTVAWWWMIGAIYAAGFAWIMIGVLSLSWQMFAVVASLPALLASLLVFFCLPESPRFLHGFGRNVEASAVLMRIAKTNGVESRLCRGWELQPIPEQQEDTKEEEEEAGPLLFTSSITPQTQEDGNNPQKNHLVTSAVVSDEGKFVSSPSNTSKSTIASRMQRLKLSLNVTALMKSLQPLGQLFDTHNGLTAGLLSIVWFCLSFGWYGLLLWIPTLLTESGVDLDPYQVR